MQTYVIETERLILRFVRYGEFEKDIIVSLGNAFG